jgi:hypothetical protein
MGAACMFLAPEAAEDWGPDPCDGLSSGLDRYPVYPRAIKQPSLVRSHWRRMWADAGS